MTAATAPANAAPAPSRESLVVRRILTKLDCENRVQAALLARDAGLEPSAG